MTEIEKQALALVNEVLDERYVRRVHGIQRRTNSYHEVLCRALEQKAALQAEFDQFRQDVSDAVEYFMDGPVGLGTARERLGRFIITKPDPLVEALDKMLRRRGFNPATEVVADEAAGIRAELAARGLRIVEAE